MHDRHRTSRQLPYDACLLWKYAARNSRAFLSIFLFRRFRSQPFSVFFRAMREISKTPAREWGEKRRGALKCWEKWTLPCPCSFKIELLKELATTNTPPSSRKKKKQCWSPTASFLIPTKQLWPLWLWGYESAKFLALFVQDGS